MRKAPKPSTALAVPTCSSKRPMRPANVFFVLSSFIPGVGGRAGIAGMKLESTLKTFAGLIGLLLLQVGTAKAVEGFGAFRIVLEGLLEKYLRLFEMAAFEEDETKGKIISPKVVRLAYSRKRKRFGQSLRIVLRNASEISLEVFLQNRSLVNLNDVSPRIDEERNGNTHVAMPVKQLTVEKAVSGNDIS